MTEDGEREEAERAAGQEPRRPRVVDKRVSSRTGQESPAPAPEPTGAAPAPQPETPERTGPEEPATGDAPAATPQASPEGERMWTPEQEAEAQRLLEAMTQTPALDWILNSAVTLANVAGVKLDAGDLPGAQLAIDALAALVNGLGDRLAQAEQPLRQSLSQLQMAYAQTAATPPGQKNP